MRTGIVPVRSRVQWRSVAISVGLWLLGLLIASLTVRQWIQLNDEGLMLQAAARISDGQVPYRDFWWFYPPGQPYLLALIWKTTGPSLMSWRIVRVLTDATVALLVWKLARRRATVGPSLLAWLVAALAVSSATGPHPYPIAMALAIGSILLLERHPAWAGLLAGLVAVWRIEFAAYLALAVVLGLLLRGSSRRALVSFGLAASVSAVFVYLPVVALAGWSNSWNLLIHYPLAEFSQYQSLPFPLVWDGGGNAQGLDLLAQFLSFHAPLVLIVTLLASGLALLATIRTGRWIEVVVFVFGVGMAHYLVVRADAFHVGPLAIVDSVLAAWAISAVMHDRSTRSYSQAPRHRLLGAIALLCGVVALVGLLWTGFDDSWKRYREVRDAQASRAINLPVADGVRELPVTKCSRSGSKLERCRLSDLEGAVGVVDRITAPTAAIYVATKRSDLVTAGAPLFYVLSGRRNVSRYDIAAPGVITSAPVQREIISDLARSHAVVIRDSSEITAAAEPNRAGQSSGVRLLDSWLAANYRVVARFGVWTVLQFVGTSRRVGPEAR